MQKTLTGIVAFGVIVAAALVIHSNVMAPAQSAAPLVSWKFDAMADDASTGAPQTRVSAIISGKAYDTGTYLGTCSNVQTLAENEISGVLCWYAGGGKEIGVFKDNGKYVLKTGDQDEGDADTAGFRGNFTTKLEIQ